MSLRAQLHAAVAGCTAKQMKHATFPEIDATGDATAVQQTTGNPHEIRPEHATEHATAVQPGPEADATSIPESEKLRVVFARTRNLQLSAEELTARLLEAAMRACDRHADGPEAREQMRRECLETPEHLRLDLLEHLEHVYPP